MASGDSYLLSNTCLKMAKKRALVDAVLTVAGLSHIFSQDMETVPDGMAKEEDMVLDFGRYRGKSLKELLDLDRAYVYWLRDQAMDSDLRQLCARLLERKGEVSGD